MPEALDKATLLELLGAERECCTRLASILDAERAAAAAYDHAGLLACLKERQVLQAQWERLAVERRRRVAQAGGDLAEVARRDLALAAEVAAVRAQAAAVRRAQRVNEGLIRAALAHVTGLLAVIQRELPDSRYDERAALTTPAAMVPGGSWSA